MVNSKYAPKGRSFKPGGDPRKKRLFKAEEILDIRAEFAAGQSTSYAIAKKYQVDPRVIDMIVSRKTYRDI